MRRRKLVLFPVAGTTNYKPGRQLCRQCGTRYTALGTCPPCQREYYAHLRSTGQLDPIDANTASQRRQQQRKRQHR
jgi:hypothetical protein